MKTLVAVTIVLAVMLLGLAGVPACAAKMEGGQEKMMEKGDAMEKSGFITKQEKAMMKESSSAMMEKENPGETRMGKLAGSDGHHAAGMVVITTDRNGTTILQLKNMTVDKVPDGRVYLARNGDYRNGVEVGKLTKFSGTVVVPIPATVDPETYDSVVIWCNRFNVEIGRATFEKKAM